MTTDVVAAYLRNNSAAQRADRRHHRRRSIARCETLEAAAGDGALEALKPAVPVRKSITPDYLVCLEDGKKLKMLKRHLRSSYNLTPDEYRQKWGLPADYPMVAPNYAEQRSAFAKRIGLGRGGGRKGRPARAAPK